VLYIVLFEPYISYERERMGVNEYVAKIVKEPKSLVHSKTIDYIENALMANFSKVRLEISRKKAATRESRSWRMEFCWRQPWLTSPSSSARNSQLLVSKQ
jgi:hypothetical protein